MFQNNSNLHFLHETNLFLFFLGIGIGRMTEAFTGVGMTTPKTTITQSCIFFKNNQKMFDNIINQIKQYFVIIILFCNNV